MGERGREQFAGDDISIFIHGKGKGGFHHNFTMKTCYLFFYGISNLKAVREGRYRRILTRRGRKDGNFRKLAVLAEF